MRTRTPPTALRDGGALRKRRPWVWLSTIALSTMALSTMALSTIALSSATGAAKETSGKRAAPVAISETFDLCVEQEAVGQPGSCWKLFLEKYGARAEFAHVAYAKGFERRAKFKRSRTCSEHQRWDGKGCVDRCTEHEVWDQNRRLCMAKVERGCLEGHESNADGRCVKLGCPTGQTRAPRGECVYEPKFEAGMPVVVLRDVGSALANGDKGTVYGFHAADGYAFVIFERAIGQYRLKYGYPDGDDVPPAKADHAIWLPQDLLARDHEAEKKIVPRWCNQVAGSALHGVVEVGTWVTLGRHRRVQGEDNWVAEMEPFVGQLTQVQELRPETDLQGCAYVRVRADHGRWNWRLRDLQLASPPGGKAPVTR